MRLYRPHHPGVTPYNELGELDYRDPEFIVVLNSAICIIQYQFASVLALTGSRSSNVISGSFYFRVFGFGSQKNVRAKSLLKSRAQINGRNPF